MAIRTDRCLYVKYVEGRPFYCLAYVDDLALICKDITQINQLKQRFAQRFRLNDLGDIKCFIGIQVQRDRQRRTISIHQRGYTEFILATFRMQNCNPKATPEDPNIRLHLGMCPQTEAARRAFMNGKLKPLYQKAVGCLMYLATKTRPDIMHAIQQVSQFSANPGKQHWTAVQRILRYLSHTSHYGIVYDPHSRNEVLGYFGRGITDTDVAMDLSNEQQQYSTNLVGLADSNWANEIKRKSVGGHIFFLYGGIISYECKRTTRTPLSTCEAEWYAACNAATEGLHIRTKLIELGLHSESAPVKILEDNSACISLGNNQGRSRVKHLELKDYFLQEEIEQHRISLAKVDTEANISDIFTKALAKPRFEKLRDMMNVKPLSITS